MKTVVKISFQDPIKILVDVDKEIVKGDVLATTGQEERDIEINLARILKVKPNIIFKYLKKRPQEKVIEGELLAEKRSFLTTLSVKSPASGKIGEIDLKKGTVLLKTEYQIPDNKIISPVRGKIKSIENGSIHIEVKGTKISAGKGKGKGVAGVLTHIVNEKNSIFDIDGSVEDKIVMVKNSPADVMAKLDTLGALGVIAKEASQDFDFPFLTVGDEIYKDLAKQAGKLIWLRPDEREIIIFEE